MKTHPQQRPDVIQKMRIKVEAKRNLTPEGGELLDIGIEQFDREVMTVKQFTAWCAFIKQRYSLPSAQPVMLPQQQQVPRDTTTDECEQVSEPSGNADLNIQGSSQNVDALNDFVSLAVVEKMCTILEEFIVCIQNLTQNNEVK